MNDQYLIRIAGEFARHRMEGCDSGHDWWHIQRVRRTAAYINSVEMIADPFLLDISSVLHETVDSKFNNENDAVKYVEEFLDKSGLSEMSSHIVDIIVNVSFSRNSSVHPDDPVLMILQDADRIDAIGAVGIARAFNYGGFRNNPIFIPPDEPGTMVKSTITHFYEKLLKLKDLMNTKTGRRLAEERHEFLEKYLEQFLKEW